MTLEFTPLGNLSNFSLFQTNPDSFIDGLVKNRNSEQVNTIISNLSPSQITRLCEYLIRNYRFGRTVPGELFQAMRDLVMGNNIFSADHLRALLHMKRSRLESPNMDSQLHIVMEQTGMPPLNRPLAEILNSNTISPALNFPLTINRGELLLGQGENRILFRFPPETTSINQQTYQRIVQIYNMLNQLNNLFPASRVNTIIISAEGSECYHPESNSIELTLSNATHYLQVLVHEFGHAVYNNILSNNPSELSTLFNLYSFSLDRNLAQLVDETNVFDEHEVNGHPEDNENELFASMFDAYICNGDYFIDHLYSNASADTKTFMANCFSFMSNIFQGQTFLSQQNNQNAAFIVRTHASPYTAEQVTQRLYGYLLSGNPIQGAHALQQLASRNLANEAQIAQFIVNHLRNPENPSQVTNLLNLINIHHLCKNDIVFNGIQELIGSNDYPLGYRQQLINALESIIESTQTRTLISLLETLPRDLKTNEAIERLQQL